jgi:hypothetical protein
MTFMEGLLLGIIATFLLGKYWKEVKESSCELIKKITGGTRPD